MLSSAFIKQKATELGFTACGVACASPVDEVEVARFDNWLQQGRHAGMHYMEQHREVRLHPDALVEGARTVISVALNYYPACRRDSSLPHIAYYAYGKDYHLVVKDKLRQLWQACLETISSSAPEARVFTDSAPLLERYWAWKAGLGWIGKNTQLILPGKGSFFFLGEIVTTEVVDNYDIPMKERCGNCTRCLDACPTKALEAARQLNAGKCLSYLTIEHKGELPQREAALLGNRLYGCDTCQQVCPWNRFAAPTAVEEFYPKEELLTLTKEKLSDLTKEEYNCIFAKSAVKRAKYEGLLRTIHYLIKS